MMLHLIQALFSTLAFVSLTGCANKMPHTSDGLRLTIAHYRVPCQGEGVQLCYLVSQKGGETEFFYDQIEGFVYEWGYNYEIVVEKLKTGEPMADASSFSYRLKKQISKKKAPAGLRFELPLVVNDYRVVKSDGKNCLYFGSVRINTGAISCDSLAGGQNGVFQHSNGGLRLVEMR
ncbi:DUF4377 domain-containing protein [Salmonirosea aquatica]|uniref:DUF4377 domain-containing protein n=1 Tax=Salmonirosea aquatica TaxID=2654236 RepID=A0A7C9BDH6_9BACT|nr:DUF4377 domain-containing protein [Cytophagaceae bacterium SJW1-29]